MKTNSHILFSDALNNSRSRLRKMANEGKPLIGYFCTYTPVEIIHASGFIPIRISGEPERVEKAYAHVPDFICPFMKLSMEQAANGKYDFLKGIVQGYTCDIACGVINIWKANFAGNIFHTVPIPYNDTPDARSYYRANLEELIHVGVDQWKGQVCKQKNIEILFDVSLKQDPLRLLQGLSRNKTVVAAWNGSIVDNSLTYAAPAHPEYRRYPARDFLVASPEVTG